MYDGVLFYREFAKKPEKISFQNDFVLSTIHRAENTDDLQRLKSIISALNDIANDIQIVLPLHPRTKSILKKNNIETNFTIIEPVGYLEMVYLINNAKLIMTDSGGLQKEAFFFEKPCITLRDETEWVELIENRFNVLAGANREKILDLYKNFDFNNNFKMDLYGGGNASEKIVKALLESQK